MKENIWGVKHFRIEQHLEDRRKENIWMRKNLIEGKHLGRKDLIDRKHIGAIQGPPEHPREGWWMAGNICGDPEETHQGSPEGGEDIWGRKNSNWWKSSGIGNINLWKSFGGSGPQLELRREVGERFIWTRPDPRATA